ncbi:calcium-responsive transactivator isoform X1 [Electrophorus electricus]|uniref:calcium-responsive transactivator isoform X1 n=1 Tax=Electrophorus electricus TaxID=8005 RepID=UPI0015D07E61|nr:calcium-responsive transactivator isoform X1 [Electrophorus electricus]
MSVAFSSTRPRGKGEVTQQTIQKMLDENHHLIQCIMDYQSKGKTAECTQYQQILHRNLVYLATIADTNQNMQSLLPAPPNPSMSLGPGGLGSSPVGQSLHSQTNLNDSASPGMPPTSLMQTQLSNGPGQAPTQQQCGPAPGSAPSMSLPSSGPGYNHPVPNSQGTPLQGQGGYPPAAARANLNMQPGQVPLMHQQGVGAHYASSQTGAPHYPGQQAVGMMGQGNQGNNMMPQRPIGSYRPTQQGSAQQLMGQEEFYAEQYGHAATSREPSVQQYYPDGHGEYSYQHSYGEQGCDRSFEDSSQHYYGGGNTQYSQQQQTQYQHASNQQQQFNQPQYPSQLGYGQSQGYGPAQGAPAQYSQYQQGPGQQYPSFRSTQTAPSAQTTRPYTYEQILCLSWQDSSHLQADNQPSGCRGVFVLLKKPVLQWC